MATFLRPLGIVLRNLLSTYNIKSRSCTDKLLRTQQFLCPDHLKKELHSLCIMSPKDRRVKDLARCSYIHFSRSMAQHGVDSNKLKASREMAEFDALFPELVEELTKNEKENPELAVALLRFKEALLYNVPYGKKLRGLEVVTTYKCLVSEPSEEDLKIARVLGWCVEMMMSAVVIDDDIMDNSLSRTGKTCWYRKENVGLTAINDSNFLDCCVYSLLRKYIKDKPYYLPMLELFSLSTLQVVTGQCLDMVTATLEVKGDFSQFTMERYNAIVMWKASHYFFYLSVASAMHMAGISDEESHMKAKTILLQMGYIFQVQLNYGRRNKESVEKVKAIYRDLKLEDVYKQYIESRYQEITNLINSADCAIPKEIFLDLANTIYKEIDQFTC